ncbi:MAG: uracil-DNA glycosylase, partial [Flavobacteriales bacterium CG_4_10_14_0_8_um_filter_32_5]
DSNKHFVLKAAHPSPFSAHNGFFGCKHFSKTNELLKKQGLKEIDWEVTNNN